MIEENNWKVYDNISNDENFFKEIEKSSREISDCTDESLIKVKDSIFDSKHMRNSNISDALFNIERFLIDSNSLLMGEFYIFKEKIISERKEKNKGTLFSYLILSKL